MRQTPARVFTVSHHPWHFDYVIVSQYQNDVPRPVQDTSRFLYRRRMRRVSGHEYTEVQQGIPQIISELQDMIRSE